MLHQETSTTKRRPKAKSLDEATIYAICYIRSETLPDCCMKVSIQDGRRRHHELCKDSPEVMVIGYGSDKNQQSNLNFYHYIQVWLFYS